MPSRSPRTFRNDRQFLKFARLFHSYGDRVRLFDRTAFHHQKGLSELIRTRGMIAAQNTVKKRQRLVNVHAVQQPGYQ